MASGTDYAESYQAAEKAYMQGSYEVAAQAIDQLADEYPTDPSVLLLKGHIYCYGLNQYEVAQQQYRSVLHLSSDPEFVDYANNGLAYATQTAEQSGGGLSDAISPMPEEFEEALSDEMPGFDIGAETDEAEVSAWSGSTATEDPGDEELGIFSNFASVGSSTDAIDAAENGTISDNPFAVETMPEAASINNATDNHNPFNVEFTAENDNDDPLAATLDMPFGLSADEAAADADDMTTFC